MTPTPHTRTVAGEPADVLLAAMRQIPFEQGPYGMFTAAVDLSPGLGVPLLRALMRVEAELLLTEADAWSRQSALGPRTPGQRRADALVALALRVSEALRLSNGF